MRVAVIGGGVMGAAAAWRLTKRGADVVCIDRHSPPHSLGSSHGESRIFRTAYMEGAWYVPLLREALPLWRELEAESGADLLTLTGALMIGPASSQTVEGAMTAAREHQLDVRLLDAGDLRRDYPAHVVGPDDVAVLDEVAGFIRPEAAVAAMLSQVPSVQRNTAVQSVFETLRNFDAVVVAAGPWTSELVDWIPLTVERQAHAWFAIEAAGDGFAPQKFPVFIREEAEFGHLYGFPTLDGVSVKVARHHNGEITDPHRIRREVDAADIDPLRRLAATCLRGVTGQVTRTLTCMYTNTPDEQFVIDFHPDDRRVVVLSPCSGHGFKFAPVIGDIAADLVLDGGTRRDISRFSVARFARAVS
jgi:sarcosine oxidase